MIIVSWFVPLKAPCTSHSNHEILISSTLKNPEILLKGSDVKIAAVCAVFVYQRVKRGKDFNMVSSVFTEQKVPSLLLLLL